MRVLVNARGKEEEYEPLREAGHEVIFAPAANPGGGAISQELLALSQDADVALGVNLSREAMVASESLRAIVTTSIGVERVDMASATEMGILVCNSPSPENFNGVAEATVGFLVALSKRMKRKEASLRTRGWGAESDRGSLLMGRTLGLVGLGRVGGGVAERLSGWGLRIIAADPYVSEQRVERLGVERLGLREVFNQSDFISIHVVLTPETLKLVDEDLLRTMKPTAYLVNTSRGQVIDEVALERALREEWFAGAALDVFEQEPLPMDSPLRHLDPERVILTPHAMSHTWESREGGLRMGIESTLAILGGETPETVLNPDAIPAWQMRFGAP
jgi:phosphoglycerate dehydrogenase-like enzyme